VDGKRSRCGNGTSQRRSTFVGKEFLPREGGKAKKNNGGGRRTKSRSQLPIGQQFPNRAGYEVPNVGQNARPVKKQEKGPGLVKLAVLESVGTRKKKGRSFSGEIPDCCCRKPALQAKIGRHSEADRRNDEMPSTEFHGNLGCAPRQKKGTPLGRTHRAPGRVGARLGFLRNRGHRSSTGWRTDPQRPGRKLQQGVGGLGGGENARTRDCRPENS